MRANSLSDEELVRLYRKGQERCFAVLLNRHRSRVYTYIVLLVKDRDLAEDVFHDTMVKVVHCLKEGRYTEDGKFRPWVMRIAHNLVIDHFRAKAKMRMVRSTEEFDIFSVMPNDDPDRYEVLAREEVNSDLRALVAQLPYDLREVVIMRTHANMSFKEIAWVQQVSINTALGRMRYALLRLRELMERQNLRLVA